MAQETDNAVEVVLAVDVGNTATHFGLFEDERMVASWTVATRDRTMADEARMLLAGLLGTRERALGERCRRPRNAILSCVVPDLTAAWAAALAAECSRRPFIVGPGLKTGLKMKYNDPAEIGSDRIADLVAAKADHGFPIIVVDLGTTTTFEALDRDGAFVGGILAPGLELSAKAASRAAARLPVVEVKAPRTVLGKSTREAMQSGIVLGEVARIDGLIDMAWEELGYRTDVIATGEGASEMAALSRRIDRADQTLALRGLRLLFEMNRQREQR